jgi:multidrug transporter EmrE-like cation transporter
MGLILGGSLAFSVGAAFMKSSDGLTKFAPTAIVILSFLIGAGLLTRAVRSETTSTAVILGLGFEAVITVGIGMMLLGDRLTVRQMLGLALVLGGVALVHIR